VKEGTHCFSTDSPSQPPEDCPDSAPDESPYDGQEFQDPIVEYPHIYQEEMVGIVIVGGHVYEAGQVEGLDGSTSSVTGRLIRPAKSRRADFSPPRIPTVAEPNRWMVMQAGTRRLR